MKLLSRAHSVPINGGFDVEELVHLGPQLLDIIRLPFLIVVQSLSESERVVVAGRKVVEVESVLLIPALVVIQLLQILYFSIELSLL